MTYIVIHNIIIIIFPNYFHEESSSVIPWTSGLESWFLLLSCGLAKSSRNKVLMKI